MALRFEIRLTPPGTARSGRARSARTGEAHADLIEGGPRIVALAQTLDAALGPVAEEQERPGRPEVMVRKQRLQRLVPPIP